MSMTDDYRQKEFTDKEVENILKLGRSRQTKEHEQEIDTSFKRTTDFNTLLQIVSERNIDPSIVEEIVRSGKYQSKLTMLANYAKVNAKSAVSPFVAGVVTSLLCKYGLGLGMPHFSPIIDGAVISGFVEMFDDGYNLIRGKPVKEILKTDLGSYSGRALGWILGLLI